MSPRQWKVLAILALHIGLAFTFVVGGWPNMLELVKIVGGTIGLTGAAFICLGSLGTDY